MSIFDDMRRELNELIQQIRLSERYLTSIAADPGLASDVTHAAELQRQQRIVQLSAKFGVTA